MILYRVIPKANTGISNTKVKGFNTFEYDDNEDYIHFFLLPENIEVYQFLEYEQYNIESIILKCDIPNNIIQYGVGLYYWYYNFKRVPFLEARIKTKDFKEEYIIDISNHIQSEWKDFEIFKRYLINCIYNQKAFKYIDYDKNILKLNSNFNFFHYFSKTDLENNHIKINDYPKVQSLKSLKRKELLLIKRLIIDLKEKIEKTNEKDINFIKLNQYENKYK